MRPISDAELDTVRFPDREQHDYLGSLAPFGRDCETAIMLAHDFLHDIQAKSNTMSWFTGCEEWVKDPGNTLTRYTWTVVGNQYLRKLSIVIRNALEVAGYLSTVRDHRDTPVTQGGADTTKHTLTAGLQVILTEIDEQLLNPLFVYVQFQVSWHIDPECCRILRQSLASDDLRFIENIPQV